MNKRQLESLKKRERIIAAANRRFAFSGFDKTTTSELALEAEVSKGLIFALFGSKQALFETVLQETLTAWSEDSRNRSKLDILNPAQELEIMFRSSFYFVQHRPLLLRLLLRQEPVLKEYYRMIQTVNHRWRVRIKDVLQVGIKEGIFRSNLDVRGTADVFHQLQYSYLERLYAGGAKADAAKRLDLVVDILMAGVLTK